MEDLGRIYESLNSFVWGVPMLALIVGTGLYFSVRTRFLQFTRFRYAMQQTIGKAFKKQEARAGAVTPFQAMTTALAATVGTGNIAGITSALTLGGPGAIFWMWVSALIGMCTKYAEIVLAVRYRERNAAGEWAGGPMYYIKNGLGKGFGWLGSLFCMIGAVAALGVGNAVQVGTMTASINSAVDAFVPGFNGATTVSIIVGVIVAAITALTLFGGVKRIGKATELIVPFMAVVYLAAALIVILAHIDCLGSVLDSIVRGAFSPSAAVGGVAGMTIKTTISWGFRRGVFSNEAGLGSAPIAHATSSERNPVKQGMYGIFEVFLDTIVICTITALVLLMSGIALPYGQSGSIELTVAAFATVFGARAASLILAVGMTLFAVATVLGWSLYGVRCAEYLFGSRIVVPYRVLYVLVAIAGAVTKLETVWEVADSLNGLMAIPNMIAVLALSGVVINLTRAHFKQDRLPDRRTPSSRTAKTTRYDQSA